MNTCDHLCRVPDRRNSWKCTARLLLLYRMFCHPSISFSLYYAYLYTDILVNIVDRLSTITIVFFAVLIYFVEYLDILTYRTHKIVLIKNKVNCFVYVYIRYTLIYMCMRVYVCVYGHVHI